MKLHRALLAVAAMLPATACEKEEGPFLAPQPPIAYVRYFNAVPDSSGFDWRPIDAVVNSPPAFDLRFRSFTPYQAMGAGARHLRIFPTSSNINVTSQIVIDTTITFTANTYYTLVHFGYTRAGQTPEDRLLVLQDDIPANIGSQVATRFVNLGVGSGNVDVFSTAAGTDPLPTAPRFAGVAFGAASTYSLAASGAFTLRVTPTGATTPVMANVVAPAGTAGNPSANLTTIGGSSQPGSALTAFLLPRSVAGSAAPQTTAFQSPTIVYVVDRHPR
jgi:hypothetical protein